MARIGANVESKTLSTLENFKGIKHDCTSVGTSVGQIPATNLSGRKGILIQNKDTAANVFIGGGVPYIIKGQYSGTHFDKDHDKRNLQWNKSAGGTNEYYLATGPGDANPSITQVRYLYYRLKSVNETETLATVNGAVGSIVAQHNWNWGTAAEITGSTLYMRTGGNNPDVDYDVIIAYYFVLTADGVTSTGGYELGPKDAVFMTVDGSTRIFAIASDTTTPTSTIEFI